MRASRDFPDKTVVPKQKDQRDHPKNIKKSPEATPRRAIARTVREMVFRRDEWQCVRCGQSDMKQLSIDHVIPLALGGGDEPSNLQTMCRRCNTKKGAALETA